MTLGQLRIVSQPKLDAPSMVIGLTGWMDGGDVSTGTIEWLVREFDTEPMASISPDGYYIYNFPGSMEIAALFRPHTRIEDGLILEMDMPGAVFHASESANVILFSAREPNLNWETYTDHILSLAESLEVSMIYFVGSVAGAVPHTRDPRLYSTVSDARLIPTMQQYGVEFSNYEGPASFVTLLITSAAQRGLDMATLVAEIPAYVEGRNPRCIETVARKLAGILGLSVGLDALRKLSDEFERKLDEVVAEQEELSELVAKLEKEYDSEVFDTQMGDLKHWLERRGIRLD